MLAYGRPALVFDSRVESMRDSNSTGRGGLPRPSGEEEAAERREMVQTYRDWRRRWLRQIYGSAAFAAVLAFGVSGQQAIAPIVLVAAAALVIHLLLDAHLLVMLKRKSTAILYRSLAVMIAIALLLALVSWVFN